MLKIEGSFLFDDLFAKGSKSKMRQKDCEFNPPSYIF